MITEVECRARSLRWTWLFALPALLGIVSITLPWFHPVLLGGRSGPDDLGGQYLSMQRDVWIVLLSFLLVGLAWTLATGQEALIRRPVAYVSVLVMASGIVFELVAAAAWSEQHADHSSGPGLTRPVAVEPGFYLMIVAGGLAIAMGLALLGQAMRSGT
ncbi:MAG TPA: hypothetical protein VH373_07010 [Jatrophihabitantaceae bacterium]|jgi:hypothetical protein